MASIVRVAAHNVAASLVAILFAAAVSAQDKMVTVPGTVEAAHSWDVAFAINGQITEINFSEGQRIKKGDTLVRLDEREARLRLALAQTNLKLAEARYAEEQSDLERQNMLVERNTISRATLSDTKLTALLNSLEVERARLNVDVEAAKLSLHHLTAPSDGMISAPKVREGSNYDVAESGSIATIHQINPINVRGRIPLERVLSRIRAKEFSVDTVGDNLAFELRFRDGSTYPHKGRAVAIGFEINAETGEGSALVEFPNPSGILRPGAPVTVQVTQVNP